MFLCLDTAAAAAAVAVGVVGLAEIAQSYARLSPNSLSRWSSAAGTAGLDTRRVVGSSVSAGIAAAVEHTLHADGAYGNDIDHTPAAAAVAESPRESHPVYSYACPLLALQNTLDHAHPRQYTVPGTVSPCCPAHQVHKAAHTDS
jgi:hypothetical protein